MTGADKRDGYPKQLTPNPKNPNSKSHDLPLLIKRISQSAIKRHHVFNIPTHAAGQITQISRTQSRMSIMQLPRQFHILRLQRPNPNSIGHHQSHRNIEFSDPSTSDKHMHEFLQNLG